MKKIAKAMSMVVLVALAFTSCKKNEESPKMFYASVPELEAEDGDRAYLAGTSVKFEQGDLVMMYNINNENPGQSSYALYTAASTGSSVQFVDPVGIISNARQDAFFAYYPGDNVSNKFLGITNVSIFQLKDQQTYREIDGVAVLPAKTLAMASKDDAPAVIENTHFTFQNIMGVVRLKLTDSNAEPRAVSSIVYEDATFNVTGDVHLKVNEVDPDVLTELFEAYNSVSEPPAEMAAYLERVGYFVENQGKVITLDCGEEGVQLGSTVKPFYLVLRPLAMLGGSNITINFTNGDVAVIPGANFSKVKPNVIKNITRDVNDFIVE